MSQSQPAEPQRGNRPDYVLGTPAGWDAFSVVRWHAIEEISRLFQYDITLMRPASEPQIGLDTLLDAPATFRIATQGTWRPIHGIIAEAEEIDRTSSIFLYRVLLVPHFWRARYRARCRNFVGQFLMDIITAVLQNRSPAQQDAITGLLPATHPIFSPSSVPGFDSFKEPRGLYNWNVADPTRLSDATVSPYIVQYNETDFDFFSRLLEAEGLSYYFEHSEDDGILTITDVPGSNPLFQQDRSYKLRGASRAGQTSNQEVIRHLREARRMQSRSVTMRTHDYLRNRSFQVTTTAGQDDPDVLGYYEYPAGDELNQKDPTAYAARIRLERCNVGRVLREGAGTTRAMEPGQRFLVQDGDNLRPDVELCAVRVETWATELTPQGTILDEEPFGFTGATGPLLAGFENRFLALAATTPFRPAMSTPKARIEGVQIALVTAEEHDESRPVINADKLGRVRVRFPWDQRPDAHDRTPSSDWIRVSQYWAGTGYGAVYTPRVGHEVLVAYLQGDPAYPIIVGRVYNGLNTPPYNPEAEPTKSTVKSHSATGTEEVNGFNEIRFEDKARKEEIFLHAQRDFNEVVLASHSTSVGGNQSNTVGQNQSNAVKANRTHTVEGTESVHVHGDRTTSFDANESHTVGVNRTTDIGATDRLETTTRITVVKGDDMSIVTGQDIVQVTGTRNIQVKSDQTVETTGNYTSTATSNHVFKSTNAYLYPSGDFQTVSTSAGFFQSASFSVNAPSIELNAGGCKLSMSAGMLVLDNGAGSVISMVGGSIGIICSTLTTLAPSGVTTISGPINAVASGDINAVAPLIKLNG